MPCGRPETGMLSWCSTAHFSRASSASRTSSHALEGAFRVPRGVSLRASFGVSFGRWSIISTRSAGAWQATSKMFRTCARPSWSWMKTTRACCGASPERWRSCSAGRLGSRSVLWSRGRFPPFDTMRRARTRCLPHSREESLVRAIARIEGAGATSDQRRARSGFELVRGGALGAHTERVPLAGARRGANPSPPPLLRTPRTRASPTSTFTSRATAPLGSGGAWFG